MNENKDMIWFDADEATHQALEKICTNERSREQIWEKNQIVLDYIKNAMEHKALFRTAVDYQNPADAEIGVGMRITFELGLNAPPLVGEA